MEVIEEKAAIFEIAKQPDANAHARSAPRATLPGCGGPGDAEGTVVGNHAVEEQKARIIQPCIASPFRLEQHPATDRVKGDAG